MKKKSKSIEERLALGLFGAAKRVAGFGIDVVEKATSDTLNAVPGYPKVKSYGQSIREIKATKKQRG